MKKIEMDKIDQKEFDKAAAMEPERKVEKNDISDEDLPRLLEEMENPVQAQKHLAVKIKSSNR